LHQVLARKKKEKNSRGQPIGPAQGDAEVALRLLRPEEQGDHRQQQYRADNHPGDPGKKRTPENPADPADPQDVELPFAFGLRQAKKDLVGDDLVRFRQHYRPPNHARELGEVARPVVVHQEAQCLRRQLFDLLAELLAEPLEIMFDQARQVALVLAQGRHPEVLPGEQSEQAREQLAVFFQMIEILVADENDPRLQDDRRSLSVWVNEPLSIAWRILCCRLAASRSAWEKTRVPPQVCSR